jgi:hypothetical protein
MLRIAADEEPIVRRELDPLASGGPDDPVSAEVRRGTAGAEREYGRDEKDSGARQAAERYRIDPRVTKGEMRKPNAASS